MYFTREEQIAPPERIQASRNISVQTSHAEEATTDYNLPIVSSVFSGSPGDSPRNGGTQILRSAVLSSRLNKGVRAVALSRAQQTHGNRFTQQLVTQIQLKSNGKDVVQRECGCGTCAKCSAPTESFAPMEAVAEPRRFVQAKSNGRFVQGKSNGHFVQAQSNGEDTAPAVDTRELIPQDLGHPLDEATRRFMEPRFGADFEEVRVHTDQAAASSAEALGANAYTTGRDIYFSASAYAPATPQGQHVLAHELAHTIQQAQSSGPAEASMHTQDGIVVGRADDPLEQEAERAADAVTHRGSLPAGFQPSRPSISRSISSGSAIQRDGPDEDRIARLRRNLRDDEESAAIDLMSQLSSAEVVRVLGDGELRGLAVSAFNDSEMVAAIRNMGGAAIPSLRWLFAEGVDYADFRDWLTGPPNGIGEVLPSDEMRAGFVSACDDEQMTEAVKNLPGKLARKMDWLRAEGVGYPGAREVIGTAPAAERLTLYDHNDLRDWFVDICDDIWMQNLVLDLGGTLRQKLAWMRAEGSNWTLLRVVLSQGASAAESSEVLDDSDMRSFFQETLDDSQMAEAVNMLGGELSQRMEWLHAEGSDVAPAGVQRLPSISPRDRALIETLDLRSELFRFFVAAETADKTADRLAGGPDTSSADNLYAEARQEAARAHEALNAALRAEGYSSLEGFLDEIRRFEAFFHGFALQTAYAMLAENRQLAERERDRYGPGGEIDAAWEALAPLRARLPAVREREAALRSAEQIELQNPRDTSVESYLVTSSREALKAEKRDAIETVRPAFARFPILANTEVHDRIFAIAEDRAAIAQLFKSTSVSTIEKIDQVRGDLTADTSKVWQMEQVIERAKASLGIVEGSAMDGIIRRKLASIQSDALFKSLVIGALALGLGLLSGGTGAVAVLAAAGALGLSAWGAAEHWEEFQFQTAARGSAIDPAQALSQVDPSAVWLAVDIIGVFLDLHGLVTAMRGLSGPAKALAAARTAEEAEQQAAALRTAASRASGEVSGALRPGASLEAAVARSAERIAARRATLASNAELVATIRTRVPQLADDETALAGLARMGRDGAEQAMRTLAESPELLRRLAHLADAEPALARGATSLQAALGDGANLVLRDVLLRGDPSRARSLLAAAADGRLTSEQLGRIAQAARSADEGGRARAVAEAIDRELRSAIGVPAPGSQAERDALAATARLEGEIANPVAQLQDEWRFVSRHEPIPIREGDYVAEVALPNGHRWRQNRNGTWCRFTREFCLTPDALVALAEQSDPLARRALQLGEQAALASQHERELPAIIEKLTAARRQGVRQINVDALTQHEREVLEQIFPSREIGDLTLAELNAARGRIGGEASQLFRQQEEAIRRLGEANIPLYDKLRGSLSERLRSQALNRARGLDQVSGRTLAVDARAVDHIVSLKQVMEMPGFQRLHWDDQVEIANALENLRVIDRSPNSSRGARSVRDWPQGANYYNPEALQRMAREEEAARVILQQRINERLARSGQRPP